MNPVLNACATPGRCTATVSPSTLVAATDASFYTGSYVSLLNKVAMLNVSLAAPGPVYQVYFRGSWNAGRAQVCLAAGGDALAASSVVRHWQLTQCARTSTTPPHRPTSLSFFAVVNTS